MKKQTNTRPPPGASKPAAPPAPPAPFARLDFEPAEDATAQAQYELAARRYAQSVREGRAAARACRKAWANYRETEAKRRTETNRFRERMALAARRFVKEVGHCTEAYLESAGFTPAEVAKHGKAAIKAAEKKGGKA